MRISGNQEIYHRYNIFSEGLRLPPGHAGGGAHGGGLLAARPPLVRRRHRPLPRTRRQPQGEDVESLKSIDVFLSRRLNIIVLG